LSFAQTGKIMKFEKMEIYKMALQVLELTYNLSNLIPRTENFNMISQINRSALSISSNIAEGSGKGSDKDFARYISIAKGSLYETFSITNAIDIIYPSFKSETRNLKTLLDELDSQLTGFHKHLMKTKTKY
jgi:four helix bundle protein